MGTPQHHNRSAWDTLVRAGSRFARPARDQDFADPLAAIDAAGWLGPSIAGRRVLCLAAGGGRHGPLYAAAGAEVTVVDISPEMLALDRAVAAERRLPVRAIEASMDDLSALASASFDIVIHPVSTCYVPDLRPVYDEVARVTAPLGLYISQHKQPASLQAAVEPAARGYELVEPYYRGGPLPPSAATPHRERGTLEYLHRLEQLMGGMCRAGFVIEDIVEPRHDDQRAETGRFAHRGRYVAPYVRIKARRTAGTAAAPTAAGVWLP